MILKKNYKFSGLLLALVCLGNVQAMQLKQEDTNTPNKIITCNETFNNAITDKVLDNSETNRVLNNNNSDNENNLQDRLQKLSEQNNSVLQTVNKLIFVWREANNNKNTTVQNNNNITIK